MPQETANALGQARRALQQLAARGVGAVTASARPKMRPRSFQASGSTAAAAGRGTRRVTRARFSGMKWLVATSGLPVRAAALATPRPTHEVRLGVHDVRVDLLEHRGGGGRDLPRHAHLEVRPHEVRVRAHAVHGDAVVHDLAGRPARRGGDDVDVVPAPREAARQPLGEPGGAVDVGWVGLGRDQDAQRGGHFRRFLPGSPARGACEPVAGGGFGVVAGQHTDARGGGERRDDEDGPVRG